MSYLGTPGATLEVLARTQPATTFTVIRRLLLDGNGRALSTHRPHRNTRLTVRDVSGPAINATTEPLVRVRSTASINTRRVGVRTFELSGTVSPAVSGRLVRVYRDGVVVAQGRTASDGVYRITRTLAAGTSTFSVKTPDDVYNVGAQSRSVSLRVY